VAGGERPLDVFHGKACADVGIFGNIDVIVIADKFVISDGKINDKSYYNKNQTYQ
jgi:hypothetical protein